MQLSILLREVCSEAMDEGVTDEVDNVDAVGGTHLEGIDGRYSLKPDSAAMLESGEMIIPSKNPDGGGASEHLYSSLHSSDDSADVVEELTLQRLNGENLAIVGTSNIRHPSETMQKQWQHLYQMASGLRSGSSQGGIACKDFDNHNENMESLQNNRNKAVASNPLMPPGGIRTKILSKSGFSEYFIKNALKDKGVICKGPAHKRFGMEIRCQTSSKAAEAAAEALSAPLNSGSKTAVPPPHGVAESGLCLYINASNDGVSLREWLRARCYKANKVESLYIFRQMVDLVDVSHSRGVALQDLRPSSFKLLPSNRLIYLGSSVPPDIGASPVDQDSHLPRFDRNEKRPLEQKISQRVKKQKFGENLRFKSHQPQFLLRSGFKTVKDDDDNAAIPWPRCSWYESGKEHKLKGECMSESNSSSPPGSNELQPLSTHASDPLEEKLYASPEELSGRGCSLSSNIYTLGIFLFELLGSFDSEWALAAAMADLRHRILPPSFLSESPKEAGFCLWLLHPEPSSRPTAREVLQSDVINGIQEPVGDELPSSINHDDAELELLSHFLESLNDQKQKEALKLVEEIKCLEADITEVESRQMKNPLVLSCSSKESVYVKENRFLQREHLSSERHSKLTPISNELRFTKNISQLESAYFSMRSNFQLSDKDMTTCANKELLLDRAMTSQSQKDEEKNKSTDRLGGFFSGLCKYARYSKFEVRGALRNGDFHNSANVICSLSFDRDQEYFATAGVSKKIKIYEFQALFDDTVDIHYPAIEMSNKSKLSCICWNSYIRNYLASTDYDGIVKLWDAGTGQEFSQYIEHNKRTWSVDFSQVDPTKLASGSDDCSVKLWNINERNSMCTIRNIANVCCVQFSPHSTHLLAFGSADYKTYCYDLRNVSSPWCILAGHDKAVSYVKFLDAETLLSASTDNTLKLWDLKKTSLTSLSTTACSLTLRGHTNEKNFVGLSVADGYIACGSETNEVYSYYRSLPMPITSHKFGSIDPISGKETDDDNGQFVSSVCWKQKSDMLVAANSSGCIKVLQLV